MHQCLYIIYVMCWEVYSMDVGFIDRAFLTPGVYRVVEPE
jgi:hypothetical protein